MDNASQAPKDEATAQPEAEVLTPRAADTAAGAGETSAPLPANPKDGTPLHKRVYRPSHRATFIGLAAVAAILFINAVIIGLVIRGQSSTSEPPTGQVTINQDALDKLGVNQSDVGSSGVLLTITPDTSFKGDVVVGGTIQVAGKLKLNGKFSASDAEFTQLEAGNTTLNQLGVSGDSTLTSLTIPNSLVVTGTTRLQGAVTVTQLLTVNNSVNVSGNLAVGASVSASSISANTLTAISSLVIGGHVTTAGTVPAVSRGPNGAGTPLGINGSVSISGNDQAGTVAFNVGASSGGSGLIATVTFHTAYSNTPHVTVTPIGFLSTFFITRTATGFAISIGNAPGPGGYAFDYHVEQ